ncbi:kinase-like domain-containing protein [Lophiotrema nucula]|uniref:Hydroxylysine kinase n=1 Tax=Lophiotrema nucula TaxID=690887 RepID=A0A6A5YXP8_9PLEO|nr:kinase-like domain-containing protein [Lophiotrema nucula]
METLTDTSFVHRMQLPRPDVTQEDAEHILRKQYNLSGSLKELGSQQDRNYRVDTGEARFVLKVCLVEYALVELEAQNSAMKHLRNKPEAPRVPAIIPTVGGEEIIMLKVRGQEYRVRLLEYLEGEPLIEQSHLPTTAVFAIGTLCAQLTLGLADFKHPGLERSLQWDLRRAGPVTDHLLPAISNIEKRDHIATVMAATLKRIQPLEKELRIQPVHHDLTGDNLLVASEAGRAVPEAVIDFGDITQGWLVSDLAVTVAWLLQCVGDDVRSILPAIKAYNTTCPLNDAELQALWPLIVARAVVLVVSSEQQLAIDPSNDYVRRNAEYEGRIFDIATSVDPDLMDAEILAVVRDIVVERTIQTPTRAH